ncbi:hypothetical protein WMY93_007298 [Mugilogobius chulae]|uniref:Uncharacterized protein n=1 Tax=Mugilogobius chulae TaxID=88201 RepID=A0AAW0PLN1_9GOBI
MEVNWDTVKKVIRAIHKALKNEHHFKYLSENEEVPYGLRRLEEGLRSNILPYRPNQKIELEKFGNARIWSGSTRDSLLAHYSEQREILLEAAVEEARRARGTELDRAFEIATSWCKRDNKRFDGSVVGIVRTRMEERLGEEREPKRRKGGEEEERMETSSSSSSLAPGQEQVSRGVGPPGERRATRGKADGTGWATQDTGITTATEGTGAITAGEGTRGTTTATQSTRDSTTEEDNGATGEDGKRRTGGTAGKRSLGRGRQREWEDIYENVSPE